MKSDLIEKLTGRLADKKFPFAYNRFTLNIQTDCGARIGVSTMSGDAVVQDRAIEGASVLHITGELLGRVIDDNADLQALYLNRYVQIEGSVMDAMRFRDIIKNEETTLFRAAV